MPERAKTAAPERALEDMAPGQARAVRTWRALRSPRLGLRGYLCVLGFIAAKPATALDVSAAFGCGRQVARELLKRMGELGLAHQAGQQRTGRAGPPMPLWAYGPGPVIRRALPSRCTWPDLMQLAAVLRLLGDGVPLTPAELREASGSGQMLLLELLEIGRKLRLMRVADWSTPDNPQGGGQPRPCWELGSKPSQPRPEREPLADILRRKRQRDAARAQTLRVLSALTAGAPA